MAGIVPPVTALSSIVCTGIIYLMWVNKYSFYGDCYCYCYCCQCQYVLKVMIIGAVKAFLLLLSGALKVMTIGAVKAFLLLPSGAPKPPSSASSTSQDPLAFPSLSVRLPALSEGPDDACGSCLLSLQTHRKACVHSRLVLLNDARFS